MNPEERARYLEGNTFFSFQKRSKYPENEDIADLDYYDYEEVAMTTLQMGDVILMDEVYDIPFWTPKKITNSKIIFAPCAVKKIVDASRFYTNPRYSKNYDITYKREPETFSPEGSWIQWGESGKSKRRLRAGGNGIIRAMTTKNKEKILKNGDRQEIRVRKYTGNDEDLRIRCVDTAGILVRDGVYSIIPDRRWDAHLKKRVIVPYDDEPEDEFFVIEQFYKKQMTKDEFEVMLDEINTRNTNWKFEILPDFEFNPYEYYEHMSEIP